MSVITVCLNAENTIEETIKSVLTQGFCGLEYVIVDGGSTDNTLKILEQYGDHINKVISEPDFGLYHAMNKGIEQASGDLVGIINADDYYLAGAFEKVVRAFKDKSLENHILWGDIVYRDKVVKGWREENLKIGAFAPHPSMFCPRKIYEKIGTYRLWYKILADYDFMYRAIHKHDIQPIYVPQSLAFFRDGGVASQNIFRALTEEMLVKVEYGESITKALGVYLLKLMKNSRRFL